MDEPRATDSDYMAMALDEAEAAAARGEVPVGAVLVESASGRLLARAGNRVEELADPTAHAEVVVLREGGRQRGRPRLPDCDLYVTLEPCCLCVGAVSFARIRRLVFAADDPKGGAVLHGPRFFQQPTCHHRPEVVRLDAFAAAAGELLRAFFRARR